MEKEKKEEKKQYNGIKSRPIQGTGGSATKTYTNQSSKENKKSETD